MNSGVHSRSLRRRPRLTAIHSSGLQFNGRHRRNPCNVITTHLPTPEGWKIELAWYGLA